MTAMRHYIIMILGVWLTVANAQGQEVAFVSTSVEEGVRLHLGFTEDDQIGFAQLDTITTLDLSHRGITDIRDIVLMPKLRMLDLSENSVDDLQPLTVLDSLEWVDLSYNNLKGINDLFYSSATKLTINVSFNHIRDFSLFGSMSSCSFTLEGAGLQSNENAPYFDVYQFYADVDDVDNPIVSYRGFTNMEAAASLVCGSMNRSAQLDGDTYSLSLINGLRQTTQAILSNGEKSVTTWVVPPGYKWAGDGETITLATGLPDGYTLSHAHAGLGTVEVAGNTLQYTAPSEAVEDEVNFCYYEDETLKGFSRFYVNKDRMGDVNRDGVIDIVDVVLIINHFLGFQPVPGTFVQKVADVDGNSTIDMGDAIRISEYIVGRVNSLTNPEGEQ